MKNYFLVYRHDFLTFLTFSASIASVHLGLLCILKEEGRLYVSLPKPGQDVGDQSVACDRLLPQYVLLIQRKCVFALVQTKLLLYPSNHLMKSTRTNKQADRSLADIRFHWSLWQNVIRLRIRPGT